MSEDKCGSEMIYYKGGNTAGMMWKGCEWNWAYTSFEPFEIDKTIYEVKIEKSKLSINELKVIAKIINENYSNASSYMKDRNATFKGNS